MPQPSVIERMGYTEAFTQDEDGTWSGELRDPNGTVVYSRSGYKRQDTAHRGLCRWLIENTGAETNKTRERTGRAILPPGTAQLVRTLRKRAHDNEAQAIHLREQADALEGEAKRLFLAVEALDPEGDA